MRLDGIHHITCITGDAPRNVAFYTGVLGLRLVAKTVNQDDPTVYHLFYADEEGDPGSDLTFFEYPGAARGRPGPGSAHRVVWRVASADALAFWGERLAEREIERELGAGSVRFRDREGLEHELVVEDVPDAPLRARHPEIPAEHALLGFAGVRAHSLRPERSRALLLDVLGAAQRDDGALELRGERRGGWIAFDPAPAARMRQGAGSIHHVAWGTTAADHPRWHACLAAAGVPTTPIIDRHFFHSIYLREPGGVLYEIADDAPGFTATAPLAELGRHIVLPPWLEPQRPRIEARLTPLPDPRAGWAAGGEPAGAGSIGGVGRDSSVGRAHD